MVALRAALAAPQRAAGLVLLDTDAGAERRYHRAKHRALALGARLFGVRPFLPAVLPLFFGRSTLDTQRELVSDWGERFTAMDPVAISRTLTALNRRDSIVDRLGDIHVPTAVIVGAEDRTLPVSTARRIADGIPGASLTIIPGAGHLANLEQPERVTEVVLEALDRTFDRAGTGAGGA
jgi:3-oxoadipate enol-lactonase